MSMRSRTDHSIPSDVAYSETIGGRREVKYTPFISILSSSGPTTLAEGSTGTYNFLDNSGDGVFNFVVAPTDRTTTSSGNFNVTSGAGTFNITASTNSQRDDDELIVVRFRNSSNTLLQTLSTTITDNSPVTQPEVGFVEAVAKGDVWKYEDTNADLGTEWRGADYDDSGWSSGVGQLGFGGDGESTTLSIGNITYYFRKTITLDDADTYDEYDIEVTYDDGFVFYVNGTIVADANMNTSSYNHSTLATATVTNNAQYTATIPSSAFKDGENILACEVHQASTGSSDLGWDAGLSGRETADYTLSGPTSINEGAAVGTYTLTLKDGVSDGTFFLRPAQSGGFVETEQSITTSSGTGTTTFSAAPDTDFTEGNVLTNLQLWSATGGSGTFLQSISTTVVDIDTSATGPAVGTYEQFAFGATWKYNDSGTDPGAFTTTGYDDSSWSSGAGELGFGDGDETTTISDVNQISNQFRKTINITDGDQYEELDYDIKFDDGVVLYVNGDEQARSTNWPSGAIAWNTLATGTISDSARLTGTVPASALVDGDNYIAVQVSQNQVNSSDVSFNMGLSTTKLATYYNLTGPSNITEGEQDTYTATTNAGDGTYYFTTSPTGAFVEASGSFSVTGGVFGTGTFTLSAAPNGTSGTEVATVSLRTDSISGTVRDTQTTNVLEDTGEVAGWVSFQQGVDSYSGTTDTYVQSGANESTNRGSTTAIVIDKNNTNQRFGFLKFDDIENAFTDNTAVTVVSAGMDVQVNSEGRGARAYKMLAAWTEATTYSSSGTLTTGGTGYSLSAMSVPEVVLNNDGFTGATSLELDASTVQEWINNPSVNHGIFWIANHSSDGLQFRSSEQGTVSQRPKLTIAYTEPS